ncbi:MAG: hypothetical protein M1828_001526 [Chrysothrix sp. TS-e1954]|nr:MAG: hypothetical protein M1828_001526 [Chrysothrix sp. TS-e1954]
MESIPTHYKFGQQSTSRTQPDRSRRSGPQSVPDYRGDASLMHQHQYLGNSAAPYTAYPGSGPYDLNNMNMARPQVRQSAVIPFPSNNSCDTVSPVASPMNMSGPFDRWLNPGTQPWDMAHLTSPTVPSPFSNSGQLHAQPGSMMQYRDHQPSDTASFATAPPASDSAYHSATVSARDQEPSKPGQECADLVDQLHSMRPRLASNQQSLSLGDPSSQQLPDSPASDLPVERLCPTCGQSFRLQSELKKHVAKHLKLYSCTMPGCRRKTGFTTNNDLERHVKSVHNHFEPGAKVYHCVSESCAGKRKWWPRQDNFKQHLERMHKDENHDELLKRSEHSVTKRGGLSSNNSSSDGEGYDTRDAASEQRALDQRRSRVGRRLAPPYIDQVQSETSHLTVPEGKRRKLIETENAEPADSPNFTGMTDARLRRPSSSSSARSGNRGPKPEVVQVSRVTADGSSPVLHQQKTQEELQREALVTFLATQVEASPFQESMEQKLARALDSALVSSKFQLLKPLHQNVNQPTNVTANGFQPFRSITNHVVTAPSRRPMERDTNSELQCPTCHKSVARQCDMRRHMRRHTRPFGCTSDACYKQFGSKNDWKRHENSQHFQQDLWRCEESLLESPVLDRDVNSADATDLCAQTFPNKSHFKAHLRANHGIQDKETVDCKIRSQRIGFNGQGQFWCGFCRQIIELHNAGAKAWDERFNHIGDHYSAQSCVMHDWLPPDGHHTKGELETMQTKPGNHDLEHLTKKDLGVVVVSDQDESPPNIILNDDIDMQPRAETDVPTFDLSGINSYSTTEHLDVVNEGNDDENLEGTMVDHIYCDAMPIRWHVPTTRSNFERKHPPPGSKPYSVADDASVGSKHDLRKAKSVSYEASRQRTENPASVGMEPGHHGQPAVGSYFLEAQPLEDLSKFQLKAKGDPKAPSEGQAILKGITILPLTCQHCNDTLAFRCVRATPNKADFRDRLFFKLAKVNLVDSSTDQKVGINIQGEASDDPTAPEPDQSETRPNPSTMQRSEDAGRLELADNEAADSINQGHQWKDVHETWERRTRKTLSPAHFGRRILDVRAARDNRSSTSISEPSPTLPAPATRQASVARRPSVPTSYATSSSVLPPILAPSLPHHHVRPLSDPDSSNSQVRMEAAINRLQVEMQQVWGAISGLREEIRHRPSVTSSERTLDDPATLDMLSETVANASNKAGEIDGLKLQMDLIRRRLKRLEDPKAPPTPSPHSQQGETSFARPMTDMSSQAAVGEYGGGWNPVNAATKRKTSSLELQDAQEAAKRLRASFGNTPAQPEHRSRVGSLGDSQASFRPESQRHLPPLPTTFSDRRLPGRPRKSPPPDLGTPAWEHESWSGAEVGDDGYYRPLVPGAERGRVIRRGAGGADIFDHSSKRTRQKPIRNAEGVLIRKDGRPDQRSISSPMNLKKVHARKVAETGESESESPVGASPTGVEHGESGGSAASEEGATRSPPQGNQPTTTSEHAKIMQQMFPQGVSSDTRRMDYAGRLFPQETLQPREEKIKEDMQKAAAQNTTEGEQPSGSVYAPGTDTQESMPAASMPAPATGS